MRGTFAIHDLVGAVKMQERDGGGPVDGIGTPTEQVVPDRGGHISSDLDIVHLDDRDGKLGGGSRRSSKEEPTPPLGPRQLGGRTEAVAALMTISPALALPRRRPWRSPPDR